MKRVGKTHFKGPHSPKAYISANKVRYGKFGAGFARYHFDDPMVYRRMVEERMIARFAPQHYQLLIAGKVLAKRIR